MTSSQGEDPGAGNSLTRRRTSGRGGSGQVVEQSMRRHRAALSKVATDSAICMQAMTIKSRGEGRESSSGGPSLWRNR